MPRVSTTQKPTTTTSKPATVSGTPAQLAQKAATSLGNAIADTAKYGDRAPIYTSIWNKYAAAGMKITIPVGVRAPDNPSGAPSFSTVYQVTAAGESFCLIWTGGTSYDRNPGPC
jgi:hypothetical protein